MCIKHPLPPPATHAGSLPSLYVTEKLNILSSTKSRQPITRSFYILEDILEFLLLKLSDSITMCSFGTGTIYSNRQELILLSSWEKREGERKAINRAFGDMK